MEKVDAEHVVACATADFNAFLGDALKNTQVQLPIEQQKGEDDGSIYCFGRSIEKLWVGRGIKAIINPV